MSKGVKKYENPPSNKASLEQRVRNLNRTDEKASARQSFFIAITVVAQMLPPGVVKGGGGMIFRYGPGVRTTKDLDAARRNSEESYLEEFEERLAAGWSGFTGVLKEKKSPQPKDVPEQYVAKRLKVSLSYKGELWRSVQIDLAHNEIGIADEYVEELSADLADYVTAVGLPTPRPIPLVVVEYQIAQKIHALTLPGADRSHDLIDLQLLMAEDCANLGWVNELCRRIFAFRNAHAWPPVLVAGENWAEKYDKAKNELDEAAGVRDFEDALVWGRELIERIDRARIGTEG